MDTQRIYTADTPYQGSGECRKPERENRRCDRRILCRKIHRRPGCNMQMSRRKSGKRIPVAGCEKRLAWRDGEHTIPCNDVKTGRCHSF